MTGLGDTIDSRENKVNHSCSVSSWKQLGYHQQKGKSGEVKLVAENWKRQRLDSEGWWLCWDKAAKEHLFEFTTEGNYGLGTLLSWQSGDNALSALESQYWKAHLKALLQNCNLLVPSVINLSFSGI